jgi:hypothetical protein
LVAVTLTDGTKVAGRVELSAKEFHEAMRPILDPESEDGQISESVSAVPLNRLIEDTLERAGLSLEDLDVLLLHGGSCKNPLVRAALAEMVGPQKIAKTPDLDTSVARGASLYGYYRYHQGQSIVRPIVAQDMGIMTMGNVPEVVVEAGRPLPFPEIGWHTLENKFFVARDGQEKLLIPVFTSDLDSEATLRIAASTSFTLPKGVVEGQPIQIKLRIDENKVTQWELRLKGHNNWTADWKVENPWVQRRPSNNEEHLLAARSEIRACVDAGDSVPLHLRHTEALYCARTGRTDEGLRLAEELLSEFPQEGWLWNLKGLIHGLRDENSSQLDCFLNACKFDPKQPQYAGNLGAAYCEIGQYAKAVSYLRKALTLDAALTYVHSWLAVALVELDRHDEAQSELLRWYKQAETRTLENPESVDGWHDFSSVCRKLGRYQEADEAMERAAALERARVYGGADDELPKGKAHG